MRLLRAIGLMGLAVLMGQQSQAAANAGKTDYKELTAEAAAALGFDLALLRQQNPLGDGQEFGYKVDPKTSTFDISVFDKEQFSAASIDHTSGPF